MDTKALRQKILDLAIRGKLVPQDPNDEPASVLLERIREQKKQMVKEGKLKAKDIKNDSVIFVGEDKLHYEKFADGNIKCIEAEIPFELPEGWAWSRLLPLTIKIGAGSTPTGGAAVYSSSGIKFIRSQNVYDDGLVLDEVAYISKEINERKAGSIVKPKDILLNITGGSIGRCALVPDDFDIANVNQHVIIIRLVETNLQRYLHKVITSPYIQKQIFSRQVGSGRGGLSAETLSTFLIPIPPMREQDSIQVKISEYLSFVSSIAKEQESISNLCNKTKSKILDLAIRGQLVPQDPNDEPASALLERIRAEKEELIKQGKIKRDKKESLIFRGEDNSYYDEIPDGWGEITLKDVCEVRNGYAFKSSDFSQNGTPIIRISDIQNETISIEDCVYWNQKVDKRFVIEKGDLLIAMSGATTGKMGVYKRNLPAYLNQRVGNIRVKDDTILFVGYRDIYLRGMQDFILKNAYGGAQPNISSKFIEDIQILLPPYNEQLRIVEKVKILFQILNTIEKSLL